MCGDDCPLPAKRRRLSYGLGPMYRPTADHVLSNPDSVSSDSDRSASGSPASLSMAPFLKEHIPQQYVSQSSRNKGGTTPPGKDQRPYCYRHRPDLKCRKQMNEPGMEQLQSNLQQLSQSDQQNIANVWTIFSAAPAKHREMMLQGILAQCCFPQLSFLLTNVRDMIKIDFISALPSEVGLIILRNLDTASLCKAAQVSRQWRNLADSDDIWHRMCEQHIARKCKKCGWGLPLLERKRLMASKHHYLMRAQSKNIESTAEASDSDGSTSPRPNLSQTSTQLKKYRPWKEVYKDRFEIGSNWKHGRYTAKVFKGHTNGVLCLQFNDHVLATGSYDTTIKIWNVATGKEIRTLHGHDCGVRCLQFDDSKLISGSLDRTIKVWNWNTGECLRTLQGHSGGVLGLHFYDKVLASGSVDHTVGIWDFESGSRICLRGHTDWVNSVRVDTPSRTVFSASDDLTVRLWDLDTGRTLKQYEGHVGHVQEVLPLPEDFEFEPLESEPEDSAGATASADSNAQPSTENETSGFVAAFAESGRTLPPRYMLTAALDSTIRLWDVHSGKCVRTHFGHVEGVWAVAADAMRMVSGSEDCMVKVWDSRTGKCERTLGKHSGPVTAVSLNDSRIASGSEDGEVRMLSFNYFRRAGVLAHDCPP